MIITTPSGYNVTIKDYMSFGASREIQRVTLSTVKVMVNGSKKEVKEDNAFELSPTIYYDMQDKAIELLVEKIEKSEQVITSDFVKEISNWSKEDAKPVYDKIDEYLKAESVKKGA